MNKRMVTEPQKKRKKIFKWTAAGILILICTICARRPTARRFGSCRQTGKTRPRLTFEGYNAEEICAGGVLKERQSPIGQRQGRRPERRHRRERLHRLRDRHGGQ